MPAGRPDLRFPACSRLKTGRDFAGLRQQGRRLVFGCLILNWLATPQAPRSRLGVVVGRRVGPAVDRSRARRLMREAFRQRQHDLAQPVDLVLVARASIVGKRLASVAHDYGVLLQRAGLLRGPK
jgi:ribonuclease P protein component